MDQNEVLGRLCQNKITLEKGVCVGVLDWMFGCRMYIVKYRTNEKVSELDKLTIQIPEDCLEILDPVPVVNDAYLPEEEPKFFGKICRDRVTGYEGMCIGRSWAYFTEKQYCLQGKYNKKKMKRSSPEWVDEGRIEVLESANSVNPEDLKTEHKGGVEDIALPACF